MCGCPGAGSPRGAASSRPARRGVRRPSRPAVSRWRRSTADAPTPPGGAAVPPPSGHGPRRPRRSSPADACRPATRPARTSPGRRPPGGTPACARPRPVPAGGCAWCAPRASATRWRSGSARRSSRPGPRPAPAHRRRPAASPPGGPRCGRR